MTKLADQVRNSKSARPKTKALSQRFLRSLRGRAIAPGIIAVRQALGEDPGSEAWVDAIAAIESARYLDIEPLIRLVDRAKEAGRTELFQKLGREEEAREMWNQLDPAVGEISGPELDATGRRKVSSNEETTYGEAAGMALAQNSTSRHPTNNQLLPIPQ